MLRLLVAVGCFAFGSCFCCEHGLAGRRSLPRPSPPRMLEAPPPPGFVWATIEDEPVVVTSGDGPSEIAAVAASSVRVLTDADAVGAAVFERVEAAAAAAIAKRGSFALAIPGGSVLKMLKGSSPSWAGKCTLAYVNHKAVPMDDEALATHAKASKAFLGEWAGVNAIVMMGSDDAEAEAAAYEEALRALPTSVLPRDARGLPVFDMMLVGVGDDGRASHCEPLPPCMTPEMEALPPPSPSPTSAPSPHPKPKPMPILLARSRTRPRRLALPGPRRGARHERPMGAARFDEGTRLDHPLPPCDGSCIRGGDCGMRCERKVPDGQERSHGARHRGR